MLNVHIHRLRYRGRPNPKAAQRHERSTQKSGFVTCEKLAYSLKCMPNEATPAPLPTWLMYGIPLGENMVLGPM